MRQQPTITLNDGWSMPRIGLGVWRLSDVEAEAAVLDAIQAGYRAVDTASMYDNEAGVGRALCAASEAGNPVFVTTKVWNDQQGHEATVRSFEASLSRLGIAAVDLFLIHWPAPARGLYVETWRALIKLKQEGRARSIGVSNFAADHLRRLMDDTGVVPSVNQVELHPHFQQRALRAFHADHGIATQSWRPLGKGTFLDDPILESIATKHARTPAQVVLRWHLDSGLQAIPKSSNPSRLRENLDVFDFALDRDDMDAVAAMDSVAGRMGADPATFS